MKEVCQPRDASKGDNGVKIDIKRKYCEKFAR